MENSNGNIRVLILEDNPADAELIKYELRQAGFVFISKHVEDKKSYIKALKEFRPDIILSDYELPSMNGWEALQIRKELCPETPFILVTGAAPCMKRMNIRNAKRLKLNGTDFWKSLISKFGQRRLP